MQNPLDTKSKWGVYENEFCTYVKEETTGKIHSILLKPDGQVINTMHLNVLMHDNGIEFLLDQDSLMKLTN